MATVGYLGKRFLLICWNFDQRIKAGDIPGDIPQTFFTGIHPVLFRLAKLPVRLEDLKNKVFPDGRVVGAAEFNQSSRISWSSYSNAAMQPRFDS